jgi:hypothetical protein
MSREKPSFAVRPPPSVEAFVSGGAGQGTTPAASQVSEPSNVRPLRRPDVQASEGGPASRAALVERVDGRTLRRMTVYLPADLAKRLRGYCAERDVDVSDEIARAVAALLDV